MSIELTLLGNRFYLDWPRNLLEWAGWLALLILIGLWLWGENRGKSSHARPAGWWWAVIFLLVPFTGLFLVLRFPAGSALPLPDTPVEPTGPAMVPLALLPLILAAGLLGATPAFLVGLVSGLVQAAWETHSLFTPLEFALLGIAFSSALQQPYRTITFRLLRMPLITAAVLAFLYPLLSLYTDAFIAQGTLASRLDYALAYLGVGWPAMAGQLLISGIFAQVIAWMFSKSWGSRETNQPSPVERHLHIRFLYSMAPLGAALIITLIVSTWVIAFAAARDMIQDQMSSTAGVAAEAVPYYVETGQNLIQQVAANPRWFTGSVIDQNDALEQELRLIPFFKQFFLLDSEQETVASYPAQEYSRSAPSTEEMVGVTTALSGVPVQFYTIPPLTDSSTEGGGNAQVTFIAAIFEPGTQSVRGVLIGRGDLVVNPLLQPAFSGLKHFATLGGEGMLLDGNGRILYHTSYSNLLDRYTGTVFATPAFYEDRAPDGTRQLAYYYPVPGSPWSVVLTMPARQAQQIALRISSPLLVMILLLFVLTIIVLRIGLQRVTGSLQSLALEANRIASGKLDHSLGLSSADEVGQLSGSFEQMRLSLKARLDELNRLLLVSQGVAASLDIAEAVQPVLDSALTIGASSARVVLAPDAMPESHLPGGTLNASPRPTRFGQGSGSEPYSALDEQILELAHQQDRLVLNNLGHVRALNFKPGLPRPEALLALALRHEKTYLGVLWVAFDQPHIFSDDEIRFLSTLAGQTELAASNARLFLTAEIGRQQMESILDSTPDPVLVTDYQGRLILANPAAWQVLGLAGDSSEGRPIEKVISQPELLGLLHGTTDEKQSVEVVLAEQHTYLATASSVIAGGRRVGRVCVLRDVTHFKHLDALKSEFVSTVSHDLRSPLTLMRGYATMLEMVGELNEQQTSYVRRIVSGVENMSRLVNNLLDLGRIEAGVGLQLEMTPVGDIVERIFNGVQPQAAQKQIRVILEMQPDLPLFVEADPGLLQQAIQNLVENAIKYTEPTGKVTLKVHSNNETVTFEICDTGIGIAPIDQPRLFEKFYRSGARDARKQQGTGLGLAIVKSIAERHGGRVWLESQLGRGSTFTLSIPLRQVNKPAKGDH